MKEKFEKIYQTMAQKGNMPVALFAVLRMDDVINKWSVIYADESPALEGRRAEVFSNLLEEIKGELTADELNQIARIVVVTLDDHLAQSLLKYPSGSKISNEQVNGNFVHEGYVLKSTAQVEQSEKATSSVVGESQTELKSEKPQ